jgi:HK97 family phage portal protein
MNAFARFFASVFSGFFDKKLWYTTGGARKTVALEDVSEETALNYSAVWCATRLLCGTGASLPLPLYRGRDQDTRTKERKHPVYKLLNGSPNPEMTAYNFRSVMWQWQVNWGNAYAEITREGNEPEAPVMGLWPLRPDRVKLLRDEVGLLYYEVHNYGRAPNLLDPWQMLHIPSIITYDGLIGHGVITHARESIGAGIAAEKYAANFFGRGAMPTVVVEHAGNWNEEARKAFRAEWEAMHAGADASRVAVLQGGAKANALSIPAKDSELLATRQFGIEEIARWYGVPPHLLQHLLRATFNNVEELGIDFVRYSLVPWLEVWEQSIAQKLLTQREQESLFVEHNVDALLRGNAAARATFYQAMTSAALMNRNECRKLENLPPVEGGDVFLVQGAMVPLDDDGKPESEFVNGGAAPALPVGKPEDDADEDEPVEQIKAAVATRIRRILARDLARMLTKESNRMAEYAKKPNSFVALVDEFYDEHSAHLLDRVYDTIGALGDCGVSVDRAVLVTDWVGEGKTLMLEAAGAAQPDELPAAVQRVIESKTWSERPARAVERVENATLSV